MKNSMMKKTFSLGLSNLCLVLTFCQIAFSAQDPKVKSLDSTMAQTTITDQESNIENSDVAITPTAFTYQGQLKDASGPVSGSFDFQFILYSAQTNGELLGASEMEGATLTNGMFSFQLDFGRRAAEAKESWLEIGVRPSGSAGEYTLLFPRQKLTPTPYAIFAQHEQWSLIGVPVGFADHLRTDVNMAPPTDDETETPAAVPAGVEWTRDGVGNLYPTNLGDSVGIGTTTPSAGTKLDVNGATRITPGGLGGVIQFGTPNFETGMTISGTSRADFRFDGSTLKLVAGPAGGPPASTNGIAIDTSGNVGIGTTTPLTGVKLDVNGVARMTPGGFGGAIQFGTPNFETGMTISGTNRADFRFDGSTLKLVAGPAGGPPASTNGIAINTSGSVGIGTVNPQAKLHVEGAGFVETTIRSVNERAILALDGSAGGQRRVWTLESGVFGTPGLFAIYDRTLGRARLTIDTNGIVGLDVLQIRGGADLSEQFDVRAATDPLGDTSIAEVEPGMVVSIDPDNPGKLVVSNQAYDRRVAGIISGAGGVKPGMVMSQAGSMADGEHPMALTGRVYCLVDASYGPVEPGDLLTTSNTPGHAMKVNDHTTARGATIGKAMTGLTEGKGLVLVLVMPQ